MDFRRQFVDDYLSDAFTMTELAATYGVSRKTGYKWVGRFEAGGEPALGDRSRRPHRSPGGVAAPIVEQVLRARARKPYWGVRKLRRWLLTREPDVAWPSRSTMHQVLHRHGAVRQRRPRRRLALDAPTGLRRAAAPNDVWTADFKGHFRLTSGDECYPLTLRDLATRYTLRCDALTDEGLAATRRRFERAFREYGLPGCLRTDNGHPFAGTGLGRLSRLAVWWIRLGIAVERIGLGRPDQNGSHEQFHHVLKAQTARPPAATFAAQQQRFDRFRCEYNVERPHEALGDQVPAQHYRPSARPLPPRVPPVEYPGHWAPRRVSTAGIVSWRNAPVFLSEALAGETVAFEEVDDGVWTLHFATVPLARWLERERCLRALRTG
jgi:transposase InsO family protein